MIKHELFFNKSCDGFYEDEELLLIEGKPQKVCSHYHNYPNHKCRFFRSDCGMVKVEDRNDND